MKAILLSFVLFSFFVSASPIFAHSGRTDSSGGHNCNVGACAGTYHYHNGGYVAPAPVYVSEPATYESIQPTKAPTPKPTIKLTPTPAATPTATPTETPTASPMVEGASTSSDAGTAIAGLGGMGLFLFGGYKGLKWLGRVTAPKEEA